MDWFTSDLHLGHSSILKGFRSQVFKDIIEHDATIKNNILSMLKPGDNLYCLGDIFWKYTTDQKIEFFNDFKKKRINFHWIVGNHDKEFKHKAIVWRGELKDIKCEGQPITLCHYPMLVWNKSHYGAWQLYGHIHKNDSTYNKMLDLTLGKQLNINLEMYDFKPLNFNQIKEMMMEKKDNFDTIKKEDKKWNS